MSNPEDTGPRVRHSSMRIEVRGDEVARNVEPYLNQHAGQLQITDPAYTWGIHLAGATPEHLRHLATVLADAADDLERQIHDQALAHYGPMADEAALAASGTVGF